MDVNITDSGSIPPDEMGPVKNTIGTILEKLKVKYGPAIGSLLGPQTIFIELEPKSLSCLDEGLLHAYETAVKENTPVLLSIGTMSCVMSPKCDLAALKKELFLELEVCVDEDGNFKVKL
jgi:hypothetical protein